METLIKILLSPTAFAVGFLWPLTTQILLATQWIADGSQAMLIGAGVAAVFGTMAQLRGSWIWVKE